MIKSQLTNAYVMLILDFADPSTCDKKKIEDEIKCKISEVFDQQRTCDKAKRVLKDQFSKMLSLYFSSFIDTDGLHYERLEHELKKNRKQLLRHLGADKVAYVSLVARLMAAVEGKKGLIFGAVS